MTNSRAGSRPGKRRHSLLTQRTRDSAAHSPGLRSLEITPELVGQRIAQFVALEVKTPQGVLSQKQRAFLRLLTQLGGLAGVCRSVEEAERSLGCSG